MPHRGACKKQMSRAHKAETMQQQQSYCRDGPGTVFVPWPDPQPPPLLLSQRLILALHVFPSQYFPFPFPLSLPPASIDPQHWQHNESSKTDKSKKSWDQKSFEDASSVQKSWSGAVPILAVSPHLTNAPFQCSKPTSYHS